MRGLLVILLFLTADAYADSEAEELEYLEEAFSITEDAVEDPDQLQKLFHFIRSFPNLQKGLKEIKDKKKLDKQRHQKNAAELKEQYTKLQVKAWVLMLSQSPKSLLGANTCPADEVTRDYLKTHLPIVVSKNPSVEACLPKLEENEFVSVEHETPDGCGHYAFGKYRVGKVKGNLVVKINICVKYDGDKSQKKYADLQIESVRGCVENFYARQGLKLEINFRTSAGVLEFCDNSVDLKDEIRRANVQTWALKFENKRKQRVSNRCSTYAHEIGHMLGLLDTYSDKECPGRKEGPADDLMNNNSLQIDELRLYPHQIQRIIAPGCGKK